MQPLPPREAEELNAALRRLAGSPRDLDALLDAGEASIVLGDSDAAMGFFVRAQDLEPGNPRMRAGLGRAFLAEGRAIEALRFFAEAQTAGYPLVEMAADRGLAFDLVGDNARAQELYRLALSREDDATTRRRLALSLAIAGDKAEFERVLLPQLRDEDRAGFRTRAFGLAILGEEREAISIAEALMPTDLALRMTPYLRYMSRLTKAQQAAAANLGTFPRASDIGQDMPAIAGYSDRGSAITRSADASLTPAGPPMGSTRASQSATPRTAPRPQPSRAQRREAERSTRQAQVGLDPLTRARGRAAQATAPTPAPAQAAPPAAEAPRVVAQLPLATAPSTSEAAPASAPAKVQVMEPAPAPPPVQLAIALPAEQAAERTGSTPVEGWVAEPVEREEPFDLAQASAPAPVAAIQSLPRPEPGAPPADRLEDVFAEFGAIPAAPPRAAQGAVDVTAIEAPRERAAPPPPEHPARHWVQVATGRDRDALKFDWRRIARNAQSLLDGKGPFVTPWVEANRLLAGPYSSAQDAREIVSKLKEVGVDSFTFSSPRGQAIESLD